jgi:bacillithiol biosynthesis deacetylase BshB1
MKLDILVLAAHPDDAELSCGGTLIKHISMGYTAGIIDLTEGELGTRGTVELRHQEAGHAAKIMGVSVRENLKFKDGWFKDDAEHRIKVIEKIRKYRPDIVITNAPADRHPDHGRAGALVKEAAWLSGLQKIETEVEGQKQDFWRPKHVYHFIQHAPLEPDFVVDISGFIDQKMEAVMAYASQFYDPESRETDTLISRPEYLDLVKAKTMHAGNYGLIEYAEGFISAYKPAVKNLFDLI